jgi:hypothetical protein
MLATQQEFKSQEIMVDETLAEEETPIIDLVKAMDYDGLKIFIANLERDAKNAKLGNVKALVANCVNERHKGTDQTPLHEIASSFTNLSASVKIMNLLILKGANLDALDTNNSTPIYWSVMMLPHISCGRHFGRSFEPEDTGNHLTDLSSGQIPISADLLHALKVHMGLLIKAGCNTGDLSHKGLTTLQMMSSYLPSEIKATISEASLQQTYEDYMRTNHLQQFDFQRQKSGGSCIIV